MKRPNFLFFITDQHRADYLGCAGHPVLKTPHIHSIAARGARFDRFFVTSPVCMPNRATLLTGRYPSAHGLRHNGNHLSRRATTFVEVLREGGYKTAHIGKSHVPTNDLPIPPLRASIRRHWGSWTKPGRTTAATTARRRRSAMPARHRTRSSYRITATTTSTWSPITATRRMAITISGCARARRKRRLGATAPISCRKDTICPQAIRTPIPEELYPTAFIRDHAVEWLRGTKGDDQPFFTFISFPDPHHPFTPPGKYWELYKPEQFKVRLPFEAHHNPVPPLLWTRSHMLDNTQDTQSQIAFMATEHQLKEAMALTCGMIAMIDDAIGAVLEELRKSGHFDDTVVIFNSDHGDYLGDFNLLLKGALPLKSITNVPFIWSDPAGPEACVRHALASTADLAPTIIERAGLKPYWGIQGKSLVPAIRDETAPARSNSHPNPGRGVHRLGFAEPAFVRSSYHRDLTGPRSTRARHGASCMTSSKTPTKPSIYGVSRRRQRRGRA